MSLLFTVKVIPASGNQKFIIDKSGTLKAYLKNPAEKGKANQELIKLLANVLEIPQSKIEIVSGATARTKKIMIRMNVTYEELLTKLNLEAGKQGALF